MTGKIIQTTGTYYPTTIGDTYGLSGIKQNEAKRETSIGSISEWTPFKIAPIRNNFHR